MEMTGRYFLERRLAETLERQRPICHGPTIPETCMKYGGHDRERTCDLSNVS